MSLQTDLQLERLRKALRVRDHWRLQAEPTVVPVIDVGEHIRRELEVPPTIRLENIDEAGIAGPIAHGSLNYVIQPETEVEILGFHNRLTRNALPTALGNSAVIVQYAPFGLGGVIMALKRADARLTNVEDTLSISAYNNSPVGQRLPAGGVIRTVILDTSTGGGMSWTSQLLLKVWRL